MIKKAVSTVVILAVVVAVAAALSYFGAYDVAADKPHWSTTTRVLAAIRERSISVRAASLQVPNLADPALIALGAEHYSGMCTGCHLAPGMADTELRHGLNPQPPDLTQPRARSPAESFWIVKHGIKMSAMPAWVSTHDDPTIWAIVAFLQQLPTLDANEYSALTGGSDAASHDHKADEHGHEHDASSHNEVRTPAAGDLGETTMHQSSAVPHVHTHSNDHEHSQIR